MFDFPNLSAVTGPEWLALAAIVALVVFLIRKTAQRPIHQWVPTDQLGRQIADQVIAGLPSPLTKHQLKELDAARQELSRLRKEREWVTIGVILHGLRAGSDLVAYAPAEFNVNTGELRPPADEDLRFILASASPEWWRSYSKGFIPRTVLSGPPWRAVEGSPGLYCFLGAVYRVK